MSLAKLEGRITVPTGGWLISHQEFTPNAGPTSRTIAAGNYYLSTTGTLDPLLTELDDQLELLGGGNYTVTLSATTGKVTIAATGVVTFNITWTSTDLRDALGFTGNLSGGLTYTGSNQARYLFLPDVTRNGSLLAPDGDEGAEEADLVTSMAPDGSMVSTQYRSRKFDVLGWSKLGAAKTWVTFESTVNESLQKFWQDVNRSGRPFRYHKDRAVDATFVTWRAGETNIYQPSPEVPGWVGSKSLWNWETRVRKEV